MNYLLSLHRYKENNNKIKKKIIYNYLILITKNHFNIINILCTIKLCIFQQFIDIILMMKNYMRECENYAKFQNNFLLLL